MSSIEYGITHEVVNEDGTKMWVKAGMTRDLEPRQREATQGQWNDLVEEVNQQAIIAIERATAHLTQLNYRAQING